MRDGRSPCVHATRKTLCSGILFVLSLFFYQVDDVYGFSAESIPSVRGLTSCIVSTNRSRSGST